MPIAPKRALWEEIKAAEQKAIANRRGGSDREPLAGLAISGGGIRSATFALGVLEPSRTAACCPSFITSRPSPAAATSVRG